MKIPISMLHREQITFSQILCLQDALNSPDNIYLIFHRQINDRENSCAFN